jgi:hypothetical protein
MKDIYAARTSETESSRYKLFGHPSDDFAKVA